MWLGRWCCFGLWPGASAFGYLGCTSGYYPGNRRCEPCEVVLRLVGGMGSRAVCQFPAHWGGGITDLPSIWLLVLLNLAIGAVSGIAMFEATSRVYAFVGRKLGGHGNRPATRAVLAWSAVPTIVTLAVGVVILLVAGGPRSALASGVPIPPSLNQGARLLFKAVGAIFGLWSVIISLSALAAVMGFGIARAIVTALVGGIFILLCILGQVLLRVKIVG